MDKRKKTWLKAAIQLSLVVVLLVGTGASFASAASLVKVKSVVLDQMAITIDPGTSAQLGATVFPRKATNQKLTWRSSNTKILKVNNAGKVTAVKKGSALITVQTVDGKKKDTVTVKVANQSATVQSLAKEFIHAGAELNASAMLVMSEQAAWTNAGGINFLSMFEGNLPGQFLDFISSLNEQAEYTITSVKMSGLTAKVKVSSTYVDASQFLGGIYLNAVYAVLGEIGNGSMTEEAFQTKFTGSLAEAISSQRETFQGDKVMADFSLTFRQENGVWRVSDLPVAFVNAIMCNFMKSLNTGVEG